MNIRSLLAAPRSTIRELFETGISWSGLFATAFWSVACLATGWILIASAKQGADFPRYERWGGALYSGDIFQIVSLVASPLGLPLSVHSAGPGMLLSVGRVWFGWLGLQTRPDYLFMGLAAVCAWWALLRLMLRLTAGNVPVTALVLGLGFVGTHLGYYSGAYSSELASFFALSILYYFALGTAKIGLFEATLIGIAVGLSVLIRAQLAMYVALPCAVAAWRVYIVHGRLSRTVQLALAAAVPCLILLVEAAYVNRWMTGSFLRTPYQFGDKEWQSVDWRHPELSAVLVHPRHGLLTYHPLYAVGAACVVYLVATAQGWQERAIAGSAIAISLLHLYLQAAWFCWWLGTGTFGMRGMATVAILILPALALVLDRRQRQGRPIWPLIAVCLAAAAWSTLLYLQGETNFNSWAELWKRQSATLAEPLTFVPALGAATIGVISWLVWRRVGALGLSALAGVVVALAIAAGAHGWAQHSLLKDMDWSKSSAGWSWAAIVTLVGAGACSAIALCPLARTTHRATEIALGVFLLAFVLTASFQFQRLVRRTEAFVRQGAPSPRHFEVTSAVLWDEIEASYEEYKVIPGFDAPKQRFWAYLRRHNDEWAFVRRMRPPPSSPRRKRGRAK